MSRPTTKKPKEKGKGMEGEDLEMGSSEAERDRTGLGSRGSDSERGQVRPSGFDGGVEEQAPRWRRNGSPGGGDHRRRQ